MTNLEVKSLEKKYPSGTKVRCLKMEDPYGVKPGTIGKVISVDDIGTIHVAWETGSSLGLVPGEDEWEVVA